MHTLDTWNLARTTQECKEAVASEAHLMSYWQISPRSQLEKYRNLSSSEMRMSVISGGIFGSTQPSTSVQSCLITTLVVH